MYDDMKILVSAYACSPYQGSEPGVGWGFVSGLSDFHELHVIVEEEKFRKDIELWLSKGGEFKNSVHFYFIKKKRNRKLRALFPPSYYWYYNQWHKDAYELAVELDGEFDFDLLYQSTMVGFREPGYLWKLDKPFSWGPVGGMGLFPLSFYSEVGFKYAIYYALYNVVNSLQVRLLKRPQKAAIRASNALLSATQENHALIKRFWGVDSFLMPEVGLSDINIRSPKRRLPGEKLKICWSGLHISRKCLSLLLKALAQLPSNNWQLEVLGDGPLSNDWMVLASQLKISDNVIFHGNRSRDDCLDVMNDSHIFVITSLRDLTSTVIVEALACGLPIVCTDHCGFSNVVDSSCGIKVPVTSPDQVCTELKNAIDTLEASETERIILAEGAVRRANLFRWSSKIDELNRIFFERVNESSKGK